MKIFKGSGMMQSGADGAMPLLTACFGADVASGDMYCPSKQVFRRPQRSPLPLLPPLQTVTTTVTTASDRRYPNCYSKQLPPSYPCRPYLPPLPMPVLLYMLLLSGTLGAGGRS